MTLKPKSTKKKQNKKSSTKSAKKITRTKVEETSMSVLSHVTMTKAGTPAWNTYLDIKLRVIPNTVKDVSTPEIKGFSVAFFTPNGFNFSEIRTEMQRRFSKIEYDGKNVFDMHTQHSFWLPKDTKIR